MPPTSNGRVVVLLRRRCQLRRLPGRGCAWPPRRGPLIKRRRIGLPRPNRFLRSGASRARPPFHSAEQSQEVVTELAKRTDRSSIIRLALRARAWKRQAFTGVNCLRAPPAGWATPVQPRGPGLGPVPPAARSGPRTLRVRLPGEMTAASDTAKDRLVNPLEGESSRRSSVGETRNLDELPSADDGPTRRHRPHP